jgi:hypothetical protein
MGSADVLVPEEPSFEVGWVCLICGVLALMWCGWVVPRIAVQVRQQAQLMTTYEETRCVLLDKRLVNERPYQKRSARPEFAYKLVGVDPGERVTGFGGFPAHLYAWMEADAILAGYDVGQTYPCWVNPREPASAVLARLPRNLWLDIWLPTAFICLWSLVSVPLSLFALRHRRKRTATLIAPETASLRPRMTFEESLPFFALPGNLLLVVLFYNVSRGLDGMALHDWVFVIVIGLQSVLYLLALWALVSLSRAIWIMRRSMVSTSPVALKVGNEFRIHLVRPGVHSADLKASLVGMDVARGSKLRVKTTRATIPLTVESSSTLAEGEEQVLIRGTLPRPATIATPLKSRIVSWSLVLKPHGGRFGVTYPLGRLVQGPSPAGDESPGT